MSNVQNISSQIKITEHAPVKDIKVNFRGHTYSIYLTTIGGEAVERSEPILRHLYKTIIVDGFAEGGRDSKGADDATLNLTICLSKNTKEAGVTDAKEVTDPEKESITQKTHTFMNDRGYDILQQKRTEGKGMFFDLEPLSFIGTNENDDSSSESASSKGSGFAFSLSEANENSDQNSVNSYTSSANRNNNSNQKLNRVNTNNLINNQKRIGNSNINCNSEKIILNTRQADCAFTSAVQTFIHNPTLMEWAAEANEEEHPICKTIYDLYQDGTLYNTEYRPGDDTAIQTIREKIGEKNENLKYSKKSSGYADAADVMFEILKEVPEYFHINDYITTDINQSLETTINETYRDSQPDFLIVHLINHPEIKEYIVLKNNDTSSIYRLKSIISGGGGKEGDALHKHIVNTTRIDEDWVLFNDLPQEGNLLPKSENLGPGFIHSKLTNNKSVNNPSITAKELKEKAVILNYELIENINANKIELIEPFLGIFRFVGTELFEILNEKVTYFGLNEPVLDYLKRMTGIKSLNHEMIIDFIGAFKVAEIIAKRTNKTNDKFIKEIAPAPLEEQIFNQALEGHLYFSRACSNIKQEPESLLNSFIDKYRDIPYITGLNETTVPGVYRTLYTKDNADTIMKRINANKQLADAIIQEFLCTMLEKALSDPNLYQTSLRGLLKLHPDILKTSAETTRERNGANQDTHNSVPNPFIINDEILSYLTEEQLSQKLDQLNLKLDQLNLELEQLSLKEDLKLPGTNLIKTETFGF